MILCLRLVDRLRGIYTLPVNDGAGLLDGKDTFTRDFTRDHARPWEQIQAAEVIERLEAGTDVPKAEIDQLILDLSAKKDWLNLGLEPYQAPICLEAIEVLKTFTS